MHRTDAPDHTVVDGLNRFIDQNLPGVPGTVLVANWANAVQEELAAVIEAAGLTLAASGAADAAAGWGQLKKAIFESNALGAAAIAAGAIGTSELADNSVTAAKIAANAVGASELADNAVDTAAVKDGAITEEKLQTRILHGTFNVRLFQLQANGSYVTNQASIGGVAKWTKTPEGAVTVQLSTLGGNSTDGRNCTRYQIHAVDANGNPVDLPVEIRPSLYTNRPVFPGQSVVDVSSSGGTTTQQGVAAWVGVNRMAVGTAPDLAGFQLFAGFASSGGVTSLPAYVFYFNGAVVTW